MNWAIHEEGKPITALTKPTIAKDAPHADQQIAAIAAAKALVASGAIGDPKGRYNFALSGYAPTGEEDEAPHSVVHVVVAVIPLPVDPPAEAA